MKMRILYTCVLTIFTYAINFGQFTTVCSDIITDTVKYVDSKTSAYIGRTMNPWSDFPSDGGYPGLAQLFEAPDTVALKGFCFYGVMDNLPTSPVWAKLYTVINGVDGGGFNPGKYPGTVIDSVQLTVPYLDTGYTGPMDSAVLYSCANFATTHYMEGDYILALENFDTTDMYIARNDVPDGAAEGLSYSYYISSAGNFDGWYNNFISLGAAWNFDVIIQPIIEYTITGSTTYNDSLCLGDTLVLSATMNTEDSVLYSKFYNPNFATYSGLLSADTFYYGDITLPTPLTGHIYQAGGDYSITRYFDVSFPGWTTARSSFSCSFPVTITEPVVDLGMDLTGCMGDLFTLNTGGGFGTYLWNDLSTDSALIVNSTGFPDGDTTYYVDISLFGCQASDTILIDVTDLNIDLGADTILCLSQSLILDAGAGFSSYQWNSGQTTETISVGPFVSASVTDHIVMVALGNCSKADTITITTDDCLYIEERTGINFSVHPNPSDGVVNITLNTYSEGSILSVYDSRGRKVYNDRSFSGNTFSIDLSSLDQGLYFVTIGQDESLITRRIDIVK